jgi:60 kDa SS-A/Ro ribonucleoprotein
MSQFRLLTEKPVDIIPSSEGGVVVKIDQMALLDRFLILGSSGTFYASGGDVTKMMTEETKAFVTAHPDVVLDRLLEVATNRLALRKDPSVWLLAQLTMPSVPEPTRHRAYLAINDVCSTGTDLLHYLAFRYPEGPKGARHSGMGFRKAIGRWFRFHRNIQLQAVKYEQRDGWTLRDALRVAKPKDTDAYLEEAYAFIVNKEKYQQAYPVGDRHRLFEGYFVVRDEPDGFDIHIPVEPIAIANAIRNYQLPRESVPGPFLAHKEIWEALLPDMPGRALVRNLGKLSSLGIDKTNWGQDLITQKLVNATGLLHPFEFLLGKKMYQQGRGLKGNLNWQPNHFIIDVLETCYLKSFGHLEVRAGKPLVALDTSASMGTEAQGLPISAFEAAAALASVIAYQYPHAEFCAYSNGLTMMDPANHGTAAFISEMQRLSHVGTFCAIPLLHVVTNPDQKYTAVISITDSETKEGGSIGHSPWLRKKRDPYEGLTMPKCAGLVRDIQASQRRDFKHAVVAMQPNDRTLADPRDPNQMDFVGLSADLVQGLDRFLAGT